MRRIGVNLFFLALVFAVGIPYIPFLCAMNPREMNDFWDDWQDELVVRWNNLDVD